ncbi:ELMO/CED-12 family-domain-containing protein [Limtongia smithiae]|uniref:ELMO/CED-12 family-domain-containing protein n=1 Tax=Limtongia smithiae TaxID=1125753 RepID=UPI0034CFFE44
MRFVTFVLQAAGDSLLRRLVELHRAIASAQGASGGARDEAVVTGSRKTAPTASRWQVLLAAVLLPLYTLWRRVLQALLGSCMLERLGTLGYVATLRASSSHATNSDVAASRHIHTWLARRAAWLVDCELTLSDELTEERATIQRYAETTPPLMERSAMARSVALSICRRKDIPVPGPANTFLVAALQQVLLIERFNEALAAACRTSVEWNGATALEFGGAWDAVHAAATWPPSANEAAVSRESRAGWNWVTLGFQGADPADDFRGTGEFGLRCFVHFATRHASRAARVIAESRSPDIHIDTIATPWYPAALASIHVSAFLARLCTAGGGCQLREWMLFCTGPTSEEAELWVLLEELHSFIMMQFHAYWRYSCRVPGGTVKTVMDFERCFAEFCGRMTTLLVKRRAWPTIRVPTTTDAYTARKQSGDVYAAAVDRLESYMYLMPDGFTFADVPYGAAEFARYFEVVRREDSARAEELLLGEASDDASNEEEKDDEEEEIYELARLRQK